MPQKGAAPTIALLIMVGVMLHQAPLSQFADAESRGSKVVSSCQSDGFLLNQDSGQKQTQPEPTPTPEPKQPEPTPTPEPKQPEPTPTPEPKR